MQWMCGAAVQQHAFVKQVLVFQGAGAAVAGDDANLKLTVQHPALNGCERAHMQAERHIRRSLAEQRNRLRDSGRRVAGGFVEYGHL